MFNSRGNRGWRRAMADFVWPRRGFRNAWNYRMLRLSRMRVCPHRLSIGFAAGAFASFTPLIGLHFILALVLALVVRGNILASAVGTVVGNPVTFPFIWLATYQVGSRIIGVTPIAVSGAPAAPGDTVAAARGRMVRIRAHFSGDPVADACRGSTPWADRRRGHAMRSATPA